MTIITHPDNVEALKRRAVIGELTESLPMGLGITIQASDHVPKDRPTERFLLPSGRVVEPEDVVIDEPFVRFGPEDIPYLLASGRIREEREPAFYVLNQPFTAIRGMGWLSRASVVIDGAKLRSTPQ